MVGGCDPSAAASGGRHALEDAARALSVRENIVYMNGMLAYHIFTLYPDHRCRH